MGCDDELLAHALDSLDPLPSLLGKSVNVKVIDYSLIESDDHAELVEAVATACVNDGWQPCGGVCVWFEPGRRPDELGYSGSAGIVHYVQALVKYGPA